MVSMISYINVINVLKILNFLQHLNLVFQQLVLMIHDMQHKVHIQANESDHPKILLSICFSFNYSPCYLNHNSKNNTNSISKLLLVLCSSCIMQLHCIDATLLGCCMCVPTKKNSYTHTTNN